MTQNSNRGTYAPWGEPTAQAPDAWWASLVTIPVLLGHIVTMLSVMAVFSAINLILNPGTWWSLAILVLWLAVVSIHALGVASLRFLLEEDEPERVTPPMVQAEPHGPPKPGGFDMLVHERTGKPAPGSWELTSNDTAPAWPQAPAEGDKQAASHGADEPNGSTERVPWRAATDIAWLRRPRQDAGSQDRPERNEEASS